MRLRAGWLAAALAAVALGGCGDDGPAPAQSASGARLGVPLRQADCETWQDASVRERYATVESLKAFAGDRTGSPGGRGATLDDQDAYDLIDRSCEPSYARAFKLYKLYTRAPAFSGAPD